MLRGGSYGALATVGEREVNADQFRDNYNEQINQLARRTGRRLTPQQAVRLRIPDQVLSSMLGTLAVEQHAETLQLSLSDDAVLREIVTDPAYQDSNGNFDRDQLRGLLAQVGMSEEAFLTARRQAELREQITDSMLAGVTPSNTLIDLTNDYRNQTRKAKFITVPPPKDDTLKAPTDEEMKAYFEKRKASFKTPELRKATVLEITAESVGKSLKVSDEDLKKQYDASKRNYVTPERRTIEQIVFQSVEDAKKAKAEIEGGKDFLEVAKSNGVSEADAKIGERAKSDLIDTKIADAAFELEKGKVSEPVEGNFSTVLLRVTDIKEGETKPLGEVKDQLRQTLVSQRLPEEMQRIHDEVDNRKLAGKSTDEIAKELGLKLRTIDAVDRRGRDADGKDVLVGADASRAVAQIFD
ncbi:MAG: peptidyl-prolyl cis-trans isomerase, partial [Pseudomonadota bacterium]